MTTYNKWYKSNGDFHQLCGNLGSIVMVAVDKRDLFEKSYVIVV